MKTAALALVLAAALGSSRAVHAGTFEMGPVHVYSNPRDLSEGICDVAKDGTKTYLPQVAVTIRATEEFDTHNLFAHAYFYNEANTQVGSVQSPVAVSHQVSDGVSSGQSRFIWPVMAPKDRKQIIYFPLPPGLPETWRVLVVLGTGKGAVATVYPDGEESNFRYPEQKLVEKTAMDPNPDIADSAKPSAVIEEKVAADNAKYPEFTLFLHLPHGVTDGKQVSGVLAICQIAGSAGEIRDALNSILPNDDPNPLYAYAESHNLAILSCGARWVWDSFANFDELSADANQRESERFSELAIAWDKGVQELVNKYGIPDHDYLLYGLSAGAVWAHELALQKPGRFRAVCIHIGDRYSRPTAAANHIQWCLTTGELDGGCGRAIKFYQEARTMGYPIIFKAYMGLGHGGSGNADRLAVNFFDYVLGTGAAPGTNATANPQEGTSQITGYMNPPYYGDLMNQNMYPAAQKEMIPAGFLVPLPTKAIADAWNQ